MPTVVSHAAVAVALVAAFPKPISRRLVELGVAVSIAPDIDVIGSRLGIQYGDLLGHRGLTHSLLFAAATASVAVFFVGPPHTTPSTHRAWTRCYFFVAATSHGLLDAFTNGGLGIAFFSPFDPTRYFFPVTPIEVSPVGIGFFSSHGLSVLANELLWVWAPALAFAIIAFLVRKACMTSPSFVRKRD